ncbi:NAD-dependent epimerase/dehydratase family protein [Amylibacter sp.]|nr:NAD-dependent epimerase/dehydratase family protein [Amylibacter sp.]
MKILVTGGAGFIGSALINKLAEKKENSIIAVDKRRYDTINRKSNVQYITLDTKNILDLEDIKIDQIFHLGEYSRVEQSFDNLGEVLEDNVIGTAQIIRLWVRTKAKLVYAGSSTKFSDNHTGITGSPYALTKGQNTNLIKSIGEWYGLNYAITYFYNVYGPDEVTEGPRATVVGIYKTLMGKNQDLPVRKPGTQSRNFTHIDDIISGLELVSIRGQGDGYGIGSDNEYSIIELAAMFGGNVKYLENRRGNRKSGPLITDRTKELGWSPKNSLEDYVRFLKENNWEKE